MSMIAAMGIAMGIGWAFSPKSGVAVVDIQVLWQDFEMRKELQLDLEESIKQQTKRLDDLRMQLTARMSEAGGDKMSDEASYNQLLNEARQVEAEISYLNESEALELENAIKVRMSEYLKEFCVQEGVSIMISTSGVDPVIHYEDSNNLTDEAVKFINSRYLGK